MTPAEWLALALVVIIGGLLYFAWTTRSVIADTTHLELRLGERKFVQATLFRKPAFRTAIERTQGTIKVNAKSNLVSVSPTEAGTTHQAAAAFTVTGATEGEGNAFVLNGRSRHGTHDTVQITVKVIAAE